MCDTQKIFHTISMSESSERNYESQEISNAMF